MAFLTSIINIPRTLLRFMKESRDELKKASWPSREVTVRYTLIVVVASLALGALIGGFDYALQRALQLLII
jgi:preprotein translocase SecE subunit